MPIVTVKQAADHLRLDLETDGGIEETIIDPRVPDLQQKIDAAVAWAYGYLKTPIPDVDGSPAAIDVEDIDFRIRAAILIAIAWLDDDREGKGEFPPPAAMRLLYPLRDPTLA